MSTDRGERRGKGEGPERGGPGNAVHFFLQDAVARIDVDSESVRQVPLVRRNGQHLFDLAVLAGVGLRREPGGHILKKPRNPSATAETVSTGSVGRFAPNFCSCDADVLRPFRQASLLLISIKAAVAAISRMSLRSAKSPVTSKTPLSESTT
jgi:hypothetical protein